MDNKTGKKPKAKAFGGMSPMDFFRKIRDEHSKKKTWKYSE